MVFLLFKLFFELELFIILLLLLFMLEDFLLDDNLGGIICCVLFFGICLGDILWFRKMMKYV